MSLETTSIIGIAVALVASLALTPIVRALARRFGMVTSPRADRWAKKPTALLGGVAIFAAFAIAAIGVLTPVPFGVVILAASAFMFVLGLADDLLPLKPYQKLIGQIVGSSIVILGGVMLPWTPWPVANMGLTLLWLVGVTNAINLLDNMDGLAAGVSAIAATVLSAIFFMNGDIAEAALVAAFAAALLGFLVFNFNPASIFMGDCGSMFVGFFIASAALLNVSGGRITGVVPVLAVPALLLLIPIFDTTLVTVLRKAAGRAVSQGGRDHTSHRLVALGLSERKAVGLLYLLAAASGMTALLVRQVSWEIGLAVMAVLTISLTILAIHLSGVKVYPSTTVDVPPSRPMAAFLVDVSHKRRLFEVLLDVCLIGLAYYAAHLLFYGPLEPAGALRLFIESLPILAVIKLITFQAFGVYRGLWRYVSMHDLVVYAKAVAAASILSVLAFVFLMRFQGMSRVVFVLDGLFLFLLVCGSRAGFVLLRRMLPVKSHVQRKRVLIYGAGDGGELLLREVRNNPDLGCEPIGFADDDPRKKGKVIHGLRVFGGNGSLRLICQEQQIQAVYISSRKFTPERVEEIRTECGLDGVDLFRVRLSIEPVNGHANGKQMADELTPVIDNR